MMEVCLRQPLHFRSKFDPYLSHVFLLIGKVGKLCGEAGEPSELGRRSVGHDGLSGCWLMSF